METIRLNTAVPGPRSLQLVERKRRVISDAINLHVDVAIAQGHGAAFVDLDGNTLLDFSSGLGPNLVGHSHPKVVDAVVRQAKLFSHTDFSIVPYEGWVALAERLAALVGDGTWRSAFFNSGAEAVENAIKFARARTGRTEIITFERAFHGRTFLALTLTSRDDPYKKGLGPFAPGVHRVPYPYPYRSADPDREGRSALDALETALETHIDPDRVAAVVVEPVQGEGGFIVPPPDYLPGLQEICRRHGIVIIADEVQTGCGRTGAFLASEVLGLEPDLVCLGKALGSGYPISAVVGRPDLMNAPRRSGVGGTYIGNPVACAAALAVLDVIQEEGLLERADEIGKKIVAQWEQVARDVEEVGDIRGLGSMVGVEFVTDRDEKRPDGALVRRLIDEALRRGVVAVSCGLHDSVLRHLIPLVISDEQLQEGLAVVAGAARAVASRRAEG